MPLEVCVARQKDGAGHPQFASDDSCGWNGLFQFDHLRVISSDGLGWDHVSVSCQDRCPTWDEMCRIKDLFFGPDQVAVQYHPREADYVNYHPFCLHIWRCQGREIPCPPSLMVGPKTSKEDR